MLLDVLSNFPLTQLTHVSLACCVLVWVGHTQKQNDWTEVPEGGKKEKKKRDLSLKEK